MPLGVCFLGFLELAEFLRSPWLWRFWMIRALFGIFMGSLTLVGWFGDRLWDSDVQGMGCSIILFFDIGLVDLALSNYLSIIYPDDGLSRLS